MADQKWLIWNLKNLYFSDSVANVVSMRGVGIAVSEFEVKSLKFKMAETEQKLKKIINFGIFDPPFWILQLSSALFIRALNYGVFSFNIYIYFFIWRG